MISFLNMAVEKMRLFCEDALATFLLHRIEHVIMIQPNDQELLQYGLMPKDWALHDGMWHIEKVVSLDHRHHQSLTPAFILGILERIGHIVRDADAITHQAVHLLYVPARLLYLVAESLVD